jgi:urea transport system substrate-binding protein
MRWWLFGLIVLAIGSVAAALAVPLLAGRLKPIRVGLLHSQHGPLAISEESMIEAEVLALEEINAQGGLLNGRPVEWVIADGKSDFPTFAREADRLIEEQKVSVIFGCWASASRKSVKPVIEQHNHLLFYPNAYEGLEESPNIVYTGAAPNQQVIPAVKWSYDALKARRYFLAGTDYVWPHAVNAIVKDCVASLGAEVVGEEYVLLGKLDVEATVEAIKRARPDVVISTVAGDTNRAFYSKLAEVGLGPREVPVIAFGIAEDELRRLPVKEMVGDYAAWNYFQSVTTEANAEFVRKFKARYGQDRPTSDPIVAAYNSVRLWAQAVAEAETDRVDVVLKTIRRQSMNAPEGIISIDVLTLHTWRPVYIGQILDDGQFQVKWTSDKSVRPIPFPSSRPRASWEAFLDELHRSWGGWANPGTAGPEPASGRLPRGEPGAPASRPRSVPARPAEPPPARKDALPKAAALGRGRSAAGIASRRTVPPSRNR